MFIQPQNHMGYAETSCHIRVNIKMGKAVSKNPRKESGDDSKVKRPKPPLGLSKDDSGRRRSGRLAVGDLPRSVKKHRVFGNWNPCWYSSMRGSIAYLGQVGVDLERSIIDTP